MINQRYAWLLLSWILFSYGEKENDLQYSDLPFGQPEIRLLSDSIIVGNDAITAVWNVNNGKIHLSNLVNKLDTSELVFDEDMELFTIESADGRKWNNLTLTLAGRLRLSSLDAVDSLPRASLRYKGKRIEGDFLSTDGQLRVTWSAELREGANYVQQQLAVSTTSHPIPVSKISFFDIHLPGATYAGSVLGSPILKGNFFFGMEHPISHSKAFFSRNLGNIAAVKDVTALIQGPGEYVVAFEHGSTSEPYNVTRVALNENGRLQSEKRQVLNGPGGSSFYPLHVEEYHPNSTYTVNLDVEHQENTLASMHFYGKHNDILNFYVQRADTLNVHSQIMESAVIGVSSRGQMRRSFLHYIERERARPYKQYLHYNCWWDITDDGASHFTSQQFVKQMHAWQAQFIEPYGIQLDGFVMDDGWDDLDSLWFFDPVKFPRGFSDERALSEKLNSGIGVWMSPFGGYLENKELRIQAGKREGMEVNDKGLSLAGKNYSKRFYERAAEMLLEYGVNYFKFDGFGGSEPVYLPDMEAGAAIIADLRKIDPDVYINITAGSWPSPFWLKYADCTWRGSGDLHNAGVGSLTQQFMTYRDGTLHNNIVSRAPLYPLNSIMVVGIAYAHLGHPSRSIGDDEDDFKDMVRSFFAAGSSLQELYISADKMKPEFWPVLAEAAKWARENEHILKDVHWIGGSPINEEAYGFASWSPKKSVISLRNPSDRAVSFSLNLSHALELPEGHQGTYELKSPWKEDKNEAGITVGSSIVAHDIMLQPFEVKVYEVAKVN